jgi:hypothetical protein
LSKKNKNKKEVKTKAPPTMKKTNYRRANRRKGAQLVLETIARSLGESLARKVSFHRRFAASFTVDYF